MSGRHGVLTCGLRSLEITVYQMVVLQGRKEESLFGSDQVNSGREVETVSGIVLLLS